MTFNVVIRLSSETRKMWFVFLLLVSWMHTASLGWTISKPVTAPTVTSFTKIYSRQRFDSLDDPSPASSTITPGPCSRRHALFQGGVGTWWAVLAAATASSTSLPHVAWAVASNSPPTDDELRRIQIGYKQIVYLLDNFDQETTVCRENGGECKRDADSVRRALGLRSTTDPLFQIEKVLGKVKNMDLDPDKLDDFFDAFEDWTSATNMSNAMAFISQFGEYNPGGGKDEVLKYLIESKKQVELARNALKTIMVCLDLPELSA